MISVTILVKNNEETLEKTLRSTMKFSEVVLLDTGSTDKTLEIARAFANVKIFYAPFQGFGPTHNKATSFATHDFILSLDSDEELSEELVDEILHLALDPQAVYLILRRNYFRGKLITGCAGWHPDWVCRLYNRTVTGFDDAQVHEKIKQEGLAIRKLRHTMSHIPYRKIADFLQKMQSYSTLFAEQNRGRKKSSFTKAIFHGIAAFIKSYFLKKGCLLGQEGLLISIYNGHTAFYKYLKLLEANTNQD